MALIPTLTLTRYTAGNLLSLSATGCLVGPAPDSLAPCPQVRGHLPALTLTTDHGPNPNLIPTLTLTRYMAGNLLSLSATGCLVGPAPDSLAPCPQVRGHLPALTLTTDHGPNPNLIPTLTLTRYMAGNLLSLTGQPRASSPFPSPPARLSGALPLPPPPPAALSVHSVVLGDSC